MMIYEHIISGRSFRTYLPDFILNPTFRFAPCGAEIFCPFGAL
ncbi:hypothetical protein Barb4_02972 [Bacteroidales bacterium Barb4]|nr:hypothetical protein Barb4_02972 [Bacteroidales bacterium Barb4]